MRCFLPNLCRFSPVLGLLSVLLMASTTGCFGSQGTRSLDPDPEVNATLDSLLERVDALYDSLAFYDAIDSGLYDRQQRALQDQIEQLEYQVAVCNDGGTTLTVLQVDELFRPSSAELTEEGSGRLTDLAELMQRSYAGRLFRVEAHSDSTGVGEAVQDQYPSNWELSAARASTLVRYLIETYGFVPAQFEVVSYGATRPVTSNATREGRSSNRRVRVVVLPEAQGES